MNTILIIAAITLGVLLLIGLIIFIVRAKRFRPTPNKVAQQTELNTDLEPAGFAYDLRGDYFYSLMNCWQREMGYCSLYDEGAALFNMIMDCEPVTFSYRGKRWLIELWKGQYGITTGAEIGIYCTSREDINDVKFKGTFYEAIRDEERIPMSFILKKNGKELFRRSAVHWWLTGFKLGEYSSPNSLTLDAKLTFPTKEMCTAFLGGLKNIGYSRKEFSVRRRTVVIRFAKPHTAQPISRNKVQETLVQQTNESNCRLFEFATAKYPDTLDKLEYAKAVAPELYQLFFHSLYASGLYEAFEWIIELIHGKHPHPHPDPDPDPTPCPTPKPEPCPPPYPCPNPRPCPPPCPCPNPEPCPPPYPCPNPRPCPPPRPCPNPRPCPPPCPCPNPEPCPPPRPCPNPEPCPNPRPCPPPCPCPGSCPCPYPNPGSCPCPNPDPYSNPYSASTPDSTSCQCSCRPSNACQNPNVSTFYPNSESFSYETPGSDTYADSCGRTNTASNQFDGAPYCPDCQDGIEELSTEEQHVAWAFRRNYPNESSFLSEDNMEQEENRRFDR